jgi:branched-chain amino acid transport system substrate-binding protein
LDPCAYLWQIPTFQRSFSAPKILVPMASSSSFPGGAQPAALGKALVERGVDPEKIKIMGHGELSEESALKAMGDAAVGIITAFHYDYTHDFAVNKAFVAAYNAEFGRNPDFFSVGGYDGMHTSIGH